MGAPGTARRSVGVRVGFALGTGQITANWVANPPRFATLQEMPDLDPASNRPGPDVSASEARGIARELDERGDDLKKRARAWLAYADALEEPSTPSVVEAAATGVPAGNGTRSAPAAPPSNKRPLVRMLVEERPTPAWSPNEIHRALIDRKLVPAETSPASVRVTLRRMVEREELARTPAGQYTIPGREQEGTLA